MAKSIDLEHIGRKTPLIFKEIWVFPNLAGIFPLIFNQSKSTPNFNKSLKNKLRISIGTGSYPAPIDGKSNEIG
jgi:hypothetical protein